MVENKKTSKLKMLLWGSIGAVAGHFAFPILGIPIGLFCGIYISRKV